MKKEKELANPKEAYEGLLKEEVKSTRTSWTDFRRAWKKDRRFYSWGRDDREREKRFRDYLKDLGESKLTISSNICLFISDMHPRKKGRGAESRSRLFQFAEGERFAI